MSFIYGDYETLVTLTLAAAMKKEIFAKASQLGNTMTFLQHIAEIMEKKEETGMIKEIEVVEGARQDPVAERQHKIDHILRFLANLKKEETGMIKEMSGELLWMHVGPKGETLGSLLNSWTVKPNRYNLNAPVLTVKADEGSYESSNVADWEALKAYEAKAGYPIDAYTTGGTIISKTTITKKPDPLFNLFKDLKTGDVVEGSERKSWTPKYTTSGSTYIVQTESQNFVVKHVSKTEDVLTLCPLRSDGTYGDPIKFSGKELEKYTFTKLTKEGLVKYALNPDIGCEDQYELLP